MSEFKEFLLKDIKFDNYEPIMEWSCTGFNDYFIFHKLEHEKLSGFNFLSLQVVSKQPEKPLLDPNNGAEILYWGYASFDGIRHLYLGSEQTENFGYIYYPVVNNHIRILQEILVLELKYCSELMYPEYKCVNHKIERG